MQPRSKFKRVLTARTDSFCFSEPIPAFDNSEISSNLQLIATMEDPNTPLVIYVPGLYGSKLVPLEGGRKRKWNPPVSGIVSALHGTAGHKDLALPISWDTNEDGDYIQDEDDIYAYDCVKVVQGKMLSFLEALDQNGLIELHKVNSSTFFVVECLRFQ